MIDDKPIIYFITDRPERFVTLSNAAQSLGYNAHFPEIKGCEDLFTFAPETVAAALIDLDIQGFDGLGLIVDISNAVQKAKIGEQFRVPILAVSENLDRCDQAARMNSGIEKAVHLVDGRDAAIFQTLIELDESSETPTSSAVFEAFYPR